MTSQAPPTAPPPDARPTDPPAPASGCDAPPAPAPRRAYRPPFFIACAILLVAAASLQSVVSALGWVLTKKPIPLDYPLTSIPENFGPLDRDFKARYELVDLGRRLDADAEDALGTTHYISWQYRDRTKQPEEPGAFIRIHVPYYTGTIDTVPHVPDRCFVAGGAQAVNQETRDVRLVNPAIAATPRADGRYTARTWNADTVTLPSTVVPMRFVSFARDEASADRYHVAYFFAANGQFAALPERVRAMAFNLYDRHAYWAKVELMPFQQVSAAGKTFKVPATCDLDETEQIVSEFLSYALPEVMRCLPDWDRVRRGEGRQAEEAAATAASRDTD